MKTKALALALWKKNKKMLSFGTDGEIKIVVMK